jgi:endoglucanase
MRVPISGAPDRARRARARAGIAVAAACALAAAGIAALATAPASAASACTAAYSVVNDWGSGFQASVTITAGSAAIAGWTVSYTYSGNQQLTDGWDGAWTQSGETVTITNESYNGNLAAGASTQIGATFSYSGTNTAPATVTCTAPSGPTPPPTTPPATPTPTPSPTTTTSPPPSSPAPQLHVSGNELVDAGGNQVILHGVDRSGTEYECVQGNGIFDGPDDQASITAMKSWGPVNAVRVPLNEACWNGESYVNSAYAGANYIDAIKAYVSLLNSNGIVAILDLHWTDGLYTGNSSGCSSAEAVCQKPMPDAAEAIPFWTSVANTFKGNDAVIFDLFNEPYASRADNDNTTEGWECWETGSPCTGISYPVAGMQQMINAVRSTGANNVIMLGGEEYANDLTDWLEYKPADPDNNLVASWHSYNFNACNTQSCWTSEVAPVIASVPVIAGEIGENDCAGTYIDPLTSWLESENTSFLAWAWNADFNCSSGPGLITDYTGTPTAYGAAYKAILEALP